MPKGSKGAIESRRGHGNCQNVSWRFGTPAASPGLLPTLFPWEGNPGSQPTILTFFMIPVKIEKKEVMFYGNY